MRVITYSYSATPESIERFKRDFTTERASDIGRELNMFLVPWEHEFFNTDKDLEIHLKFSGEIIVRGHDEQQCKNKIDTIKEMIEKIFGPPPLSYSPTKLLQVELKEDVETHINRIVFKKVIDIVKSQISPEYDVKDVSFLFTGDANIRAPERLGITFERVIPYKRGEEIAPFKVTIVGPTKETCENILELLIKELEMNIRT